jgi:MFS family permease
VGTTSTPAGLRRKSFAAFRHRDFNAFQTARTLAILATQMQSVAIGWQIYSLTRRPIDLAWVGFAQFLPGVCFSLLAGHAADRFERRHILLVCYAAMAAWQLVLFAAARHGGHDLAAVYTVLVCIGVTRAFQGPAQQSILPNLVPAEDFPSAVAWGSSLWQTAMVLGPSAGGLAYAALGGAAGVYTLASACSLAALALVATMRPVVARLGGRNETVPRRSEPVTRTSLLAGVRYVWANEIVLGAITLDLFAVFLGGATALLPVYARDVLHLGPWALGVLRSAPAVGAAATAIVLAFHPIERRAGPKMLVCVAAFGAATICFGLSRDFVLSLFALFAVGASDMVSVFVRSALVQLATPDAMRGRVSAVNMVFIGASNELGEFESGVTAQWLGAVPSVVLGGVGTVAVVLACAWRFPKLRRVDSLTRIR